MIHVERTPTPNVLIRYQASWTEALLNVAEAKVRRRVQINYKHLAIKDALELMFHGKCAYCESKINHVGYAHIEHFRPKSSFPEKTFEWSNLLLACSRCNGAQQKGDQFPAESEGGPLINPCDDFPEEHFEFVYDSLSGLASVLFRTDRGRVTCDLLGLNRPALREYRSCVVKKLLVLSRFAQNDPEAHVLLLEALNAESEYAAFAKNLVAARTLA